MATYIVGQSRPPAHEQAFGQCAVHVTSLRSQVDDEISGRKRASHTYALRGRRVQDDKDLVRLPETIRYKQI